MAHAIIFVDRAPRTRETDLTSLHYMHFAGATKVASILRQQGLDVLVVPNCLNLSFAGIKQIIENNKSNLLWVGLSTTLMGMQVEKDDIDSYYNLWLESVEPIIDIEFLIKKVSENGPDHLLWNSRILGRISHTLASKYQVPFVIGGAYASLVDTQGILVHPNMHVVKGYAESYISELTQCLLSNPQQPVPYIVNNNNYDNDQFKHSQIIWNTTDCIEPDDWLPIEIARGCAFNCAYCNFPKRGTFDAYKNPDALRQELIRNYEQYGVSRYLLVDDLYNDSKDKVRILYDKVWSRLPFKPEWASFMRLDMFWADPDSAEIIKASGARYGSFGIETLNDRAGTKVGKGLGKKRIIETLEMLKHVWKDQVLVGANMIAGLPFEPLDSIHASIDWTMTTDLIHGAVWTPMYLNPPEFVNRNFNPDKNRLETDFEKFGVTWLDQNNWINSAGVSKQQAFAAVSGYKPQNPWSGKFSQTTYADVRSAGFTHEQIANIRNNTISESDMCSAAQSTKQKISSRLKKLLEICN